MHEFLKTFTYKSTEIKTSGRWDALNKRLERLYHNNTGHEAWQITVISALCTKNFLEFNALETAYKTELSNPSLLAWHARNLLEIAVWSLYCSASKENTRRFYEDAGRDAVDICNSFAEWGENNYQNQEWLGIFKDKKNEIEQSAQSVGIDSIEGSYKRINAAAHEIGIQDIFKVAYKLLSKFAHPTAMQIVAAPNSDTEKGQKDYFYSQGCLYFEGAFNALDQTLLELDL